MRRLSSFLVLGLILLVLSAYALVWLVTERLPELPERGLMYFLVITFFTGAALPILGWLYRTFSPTDEIDSVSVVRESLAVGIVAAVLLWFQVGRALTPAVIFMTVGGFVMIELLLRMSDLLNKNNIKDTDEED